MGFRIHPPGKPVLGTPKNITKIFYTARIEDQELEAYLDWAIIFSLGCKQYKIPVPDPDHYLNDCLRIFREEKQYAEGKIMYIIRKKMNKIKFGIECGRIVRRIK